MRKYLSRPTARPRGAVLESSRALLLELQQRIRKSGFSQRDLERKRGFSKGYLSQVLKGKIDLKMEDLLALLATLGMSPGDFFAAVEGRPAMPTGPGAAPGRPEFDLEETLGRVVAGLQAFGDLRQRLERCERILAEAGSFLPDSACS